MKAKEFIAVLKKQFGCGFFTGVPDSQLKELCDYFMREEGENHLICANEGNAAAVAAGTYLATGKIPVVYMQNSGIGNIVNPSASLCDPKVYGIPCVYVVGWRGEPNVKDEPQHIFQGEITLELFKVLGIATVVIDPLTTVESLEKSLAEYKADLEQGKSIAVIVKKGAFTADEKFKYGNSFLLNREEVIRQIAEASGEDIVVCTTGKASRELFEIREKAGKSHKYDFLTVGSMGHSSSIALGIAKNTPDKRVWCIDGDGAAIMHMGAMSTMGLVNPQNLIHIVINNQAHETVGGMPTAARAVCFTDIAKGCGYPVQMRAETQAQLTDALNKAKKEGRLTFIEICAGLGARADLGRPTTTPRQNKEIFCKHIREV